MLPLLSPFHRGAARTRTRQDRICQSCGARASPESFRRRRSRCSTRGPLDGQLGFARPDSDSAPSYDGWSECRGQHALRTSDGDDHARTEVAFTEAGSARGGGQGRHELVQLERSRTRPRRDSPCTEPARTGPAPHAAHAWSLHLGDFGNSFRCLALPFASTFTTHRGARSVRRASRIGRRARLFRRSARAIQDARSRRRSALTVPFGAEKLAVAVSVTVTVTITIPIPAAVTVSVEVDNALSFPRSSQRPPARRDAVVSRVERWRHFGSARPDPRARRRRRHQQRRCADRTSRGGQGERLYSCSPRRRRPRSTRSDGGCVRRRRSSRRTWTRPVEASR